MDKSESKKEEASKNDQLNSHLKQLELEMKVNTSQEKASDLVKNKWLKSKCRIIKNLIVIGFAWMFLFTVEITEF